MIVSQFNMIGFRGRFDVRFDFHGDVNYIIGRNGTGKTTLVKMLVAALNGNGAQLSRMAFQEITVIFVESEGSLETTRLVYSRALPNGNFLSEGGFRVQMYRPDGSELVSTSTFFSRRRRSMLAPRNESDLFLPSDDEAGGNSSDAASGTEQRSAEHRARAAEAANAIRRTLDGGALVRWLPVERVTRRVNDPEEEDRTPIDIKVDELQNLLVRYFSELDKTAAVEFQSFRNATLLSLFKVEGTGESARSRASKADIGELEQDLKQLIPELKLDKDSEEQFRESAQTLLTKLRNRERGRPFEALRQAAARLEDIVALWRKTQSRVSDLYGRRDKFLNYLADAFALKDIKEPNRLKFAKLPCLADNNEMAFIQEYPGAETPVSLLELSSGEKQFFIMLAEALLERNHQTILIIDEPELSLHIDWQARLVRDLQQLKPKAQLILATHSPDIVQIKKENIIQIEDVVSVRTA